MENSYLKLRWRTTTNRAEQKQRREPILVKLMSLEAEDWGYIYGEAQIYIINSKMGSGEQLPGIAMKNDDTHGVEQKRWRENQSLWSWCVKAEDWGYIWWRERSGDAMVKGEDWRLFLVFSKKFWWNCDLQIARYWNRNGKLPFQKREFLLIPKRNPTNFA